MFKVVLFLILIALPFTISAQILTERSFVNTGLAFVNHDYDYDAVKSGKISVVPVFGFFKVDKKKNIDEFQVYDISFREVEYISLIPPIGFATQPASGSANRTFSISAAYHKIISLNKKSTSKFHLGIGFGVLTFYDYLKTIPVVSTSFPATVSTVGIASSIKPVINYMISDRIFLGISTALYVGETTKRTHRIMNPAFTQPEERISYIETTFLTNNAFNLQMLLGINLR